MTLVLYADVARYDSGTAMEQLDAVYALADHGSSPHGAATVSLRFA